ncbi:MAG: HIT family protein [gamma proteobacterium symbiont of Taylorina sp.]|nr:HIT family protein [gamma proteobacterium symbiont of Taylorina sp.]
MKEQFKLDSRLQNDCFVLSESEQFLILLLNNSLIPWFIFVPKTDKTELFQLDKKFQSEIFEKINHLSEFIMTEYKVDKLNVAAIGNIVSQMHIHVVGRYQTDPYWPGVVWGADKKKIYTQEEVKKIKIRLNSILVI